jgi:hypothetical protein
MSTVITEKEVRDALRQAGYRNPTEHQKRKMISILRDYRDIDRVRELRDARRFKMVDGVMTDTYAVRTIP